MMAGKIDLRFDHCGARLRHCIARRWILAVGAALVVCLPPVPAPAAAENLDATAGPSLASRLGEIAGAVYDKAQSDLILPSRQAAGEVLADPRAQNMYRHLSDAARGVAGLADPAVFQPVLRRSYEAVSSVAGDLIADLIEGLRRRIVAPLIAGLKRAVEGAFAASPAPPPLAGAAPVVAVAADPLREASAIPGLPDSDISRNLTGNDPLEPFNRLMFRLNGGLQAKLLDPVSRLYVEHTSPEVQLGVGNFFRNLREPATLVSSALEGQLDDAETAAARFGINTTLGVAGFRDPATEMGFTVRPRNFEETLCSYGLPSGPYLVLPVLGPATLRDTAGRIATVVMYFEVMGAPVYIPYRVSDITVQYSNVREKIGLINQLAPDPYVAQKALYLALHGLSCGGQALAYREFFTK
jgi:phospholipid-binding lipoprotein MlaA